MYHFHSMLRAKCLLFFFLHCSARCSTLCAFRSGKTIVFILYHHIKFPCLMHGVSNKLRANDCDAKWIGVYYVTELRTLIFRLVCHRVVEQALAIQANSMEFCVVKAEFNGWFGTIFSFAFAFNLLHVYASLSMYQWWKSFTESLTAVRAYCSIRKEFAHLNICFWLNAVSHLPRKMSLFQLVFFPCVCHIFACSFAKFRNASSNLISRQQHFAHTTKSNMQSK